MSTDFGSGAGTPRGEREQFVAASAEGGPTSSARSRTPSAASSGENFQARAQEARRLLAEGEEAALIAYLTGQPVERVREVMGADDA